MTEAPAKSTPRGPPSSERVGRILAGRWRLHELLGEGGAGAVYVATGPDKVRVAVKVLHPEMAAEEGVRQRFVREAYVANRVDHPDVVQILEDGEDEDGAPYIVMELLEGETFEARAIRKGGRLPITEVLWLADRTLHVLAAAHAKGIVHRDIKPDNLFLTHDRKLKVLDFGIARLADGEHAVTRVGTILGTLAYMPPEQARGATAEISVQSDLWSVGATMFTLLSGKLVRDDKDVAKVLREAGRTEVPSLKEAAPDLPHEVVQLVDYALSLKMDVRWPTARMMRRAVRLVYARVQRAATHGPDSEDGEPISDPSFDFAAANLPIEAPPMSIGRPSYTNEFDVNADTQPSPPSVGPPRSFAMTTLSSATSKEPAGEPKTVPVTDSKSASAAAVKKSDARHREVQASRAKVSRILVWVLFGVVLVLAVIVLVLVLKR